MGTAFILVIGGGVTLFASVLVFMGIVPLYVAKVTPIASSFYAVTASPIGQPAPEENNGDLAALIDWILSEQGQWLIEQTGYVGLR